LPDDRYKNFVFIPSDLAEDVDLSLEQKKEILFLHGQLGRLDHWQVLGLRWNAPAEAARVAYLELAKRFHPDRHGGRRLGAYLPRIEKVFRALTEARDVLTNEHRRAEYARRTAPPDEFARMEARRLEDESRLQERRARLGRANPLLARASRVNDLVSRGKKAMSEGRYAQAANDFLSASGLDPRHPEARALAQDARRLAGRERARELYDRGLAAEVVGNMASAAEAFRGAAEAEPASVRYAVAASRACLATGASEEARSFAEAAVRAGPSDGRAHEALGAALEALGDAKEARQSLERALQLDPGLERARSALKKLRWSFLR
jgi:curved DNA-binding protein CbpA